MSLGGPLRYNRLHEILDQERGLWQIPLLDGPQKASRRLLGLCGGLQDGARRACTGLNIHRTAPDWTAASFNLRLVEILPGSVEDWGIGFGRTSDRRLMVGRRTIRAKVIA